MVDIAFYLVTEEIARRSGVIDSKYRTVDGRFILDNKDLSHIRFTSDEYINGLAGVEKITKNEAMYLIQQNNYAMGLPANAQPAVVVEEETLAETESEAAQTEENNEVEQQPTEEEETAQNEENGGGEESISEEEVGSVEDVLGDVLNEEENNEQTNEEEE